MKSESMFAMSRREAALAPTSFALTPLTGVLASEIKFRRRTAQGET